MTKIVPVYKLTCLKMKRKHNLCLSIHHEVYSISCFWLCIKVPVYMTRLLGPRTFHHPSPWLPEYPSICHPCLVSLLLETHLQVQEGKFKISCYVNVKTIIFIDFLQGTCTGTKYYRGNLIKVQNLHYTVSSIQTF